jgi:hypothetical protein
MEIERKIAALGLSLPLPLKVPANVRVPFSWIRVRGNRAYISGHGPQQADGSLAGPFGKVGGEVTPEAAYASARLTALSMLGSLQREPSIGSPAGSVCLEWSTRLPDFASNRP